MISWVTSALLRAILVALLVVTPSLLLPTTDEFTAEFAMVLALLGGAMTFIEYFGRSPSLVEFRFAPPYNRLKFIGLAATILGLSLVCRSQSDPFLLGVLLGHLGAGLGALLDFPYSPIRLIVLMLPADADAALIVQVRTAAGIAYAVSLLMIAAFVIVIRLGDWPTRTGAFNMWMNLPLFDPTGGGDILRRLHRDSGLNLVLGFLLPFLIPAGVKAATDLFDPMLMADEHTLIWMTTAWAFLPASMIMRGVALNRIAAMVEYKRRRVYALAAAEPVQRA